jgi:hypothetical protein
MAAPGGFINSLRGNGMMTSCNAMTPDRYGITTRRNNITIHR